MAGDVTLNLFANFADTVSTVSLRGESVSYFVSLAVVQAILFSGLALRGVAVNFENAVDFGAGAIAVGVFQVAEARSFSVVGAAVGAQAALDPLRFDIKS